MYLPMKILSEKQAGIEIVEEGFLDWSNWKIHQPELHKGQGTEDRTTEGTNQGLQCRWDLEQMRNDPTICGSKH